MSRDKQVAPNVADAVALDVFVFLFVFPNAHVVIALIDVESEAVFGIGSPGVLGVDVVETIKHIVVLSALLLADLTGNVKQCFREGLAASDNETGVFQSARAFHGKSQIRQTCAQGAFQLCGVAFLGGKVDDGGQLAAITRGEAALVDIHRVDHLGVEHRHKTAKVVDIDKWHIVEHIEVLARIAAAHNHQAGGFGGCLDAGQLLCCLDNVGATAQGGDLVDTLCRESQSVEGLALDAGSIDFDGLKGFGQRFQMDLQRLVNMIHLDAFFFIPYARNAKCGGQLDGKVKIPLLVGGHPF